MVATRKLLIPREFLGLPRTAQLCENLNRRITAMSWVTPEFEEILLNCEINSYASAEV
jgi:coenzyme PQQ precursor peptide PqqA